MELGEIRVGAQWTLISSPPPPPPPPHPPTHYTKARAPGKMQGGRAVGLPGVFFVYDFSSFLVRKTEESTQPSFVRFLMRICAVVGGVFTVAGLVDSLVYHGSKAMKKD